MMSDVRRHAITFTVRGPLAPADLAALCARVCAMLPDDTRPDDEVPPDEATPDDPGVGQSATSAIYCDVGDVAADAAAIEALARLQLAARRCGCQVRLRNASRELLDLVALVGLSDILPDGTE